MNVKYLAIGVVVVLAVAYLYFSGYLFSIYGIEGMQVGCGSRGGCPGGQNVWVSANGALGSYNISVDSGFPAYYRDGTVASYGPGMYCGGRMVVYNSGVKVYETPKYVAGSTWVYGDGQKPLPVGVGVFSTSLFTVNLVYGGGSQYSNCYAIAPITFNTTYMRDHFNISMSLGQTTYFKGQNATINMYITNNIMSNLQFAGNIELCTPVFSAQQYCQSYSQNKVLQMGVNTVQLQIPTDYVTTQLNARVTYNVYFPTNYFGGDIYSTQSITKFGAGDLVDIFGTQQGQTATVTVIPRPLIGGSCNETTVCPNGYTCSKLTSGQQLCLDSGVLNLQLSCMTTGCPTGPNLDYSCTSAGICAETIIQPVEVDCSTTGCGPGLSCVKSGNIAYCLKTEFVDVIKQCTQAADCVVPCQGVTTSCVGGICQYSGSCTPTTVGCVQLGCSADYGCNTQTNACEKIVYVNQNCAQLGCDEGFTCNAQQGTCNKVITNTQIVTQVQNQTVYVPTPTVPQENNMYVYVVLAIIIAVIVGAVIMRLRR